MLCALLLLLFACGVSDCLKCNCGHHMAVKNNKNEKELHNVLDPRIDEICLGKTECEITNGSTVWNVAKAQTNWAKTKDRLLEPACVLATAGHYQAASCTVRHKRKKAAAKPEKHETTFFNYTICTTDLCNAAKKPGIVFMSAMPAVKWSGVEDAGQQTHKKGKTKKKKKIGTGQPKKGKKKTTTSPPLPN